MPRLVTTLLLVLQFHPVVGAVACVEQSLATHRRCEMTALGEGGSSGSGTASLSGAAAGSLSPDAAETLPAIDRTAPPVPPPNR